MNILYYNIRVISSFDKEKLDELLKKFYLIVGIRFSISDDQFNLVTEYPVNPPQFCRNIREIKDGLMACRRCDLEAFKRVKEFKKPYIYTCHAGVREAMTPIMEQDKVIGYAILAHMMPKEDYTKAVKEACMKAKRFNIEEEESKKALEQLSRKSVDEINAAVTLLDALANYVTRNNYAKWKNENIADDIEKFVKSNLDKELSSDILCEKFHTSRSLLYRISLKAFDMSIMKYVTTQRVEKAKQLIKDGKQIKDVSYLVGYNDYSYFDKVFKKFVGCSPKAYKKQLS